MGIRYGLGARRGRFACVGALALSLAGCGGGTETPAPEDRPDSEPSAAGGAAEGVFIRYDATDPDAAVFDAGIRAMRALGSCSVDDDGPFRRWLSVDPAASAPSGFGRCGVTRRGFGLGVRGPGIERDGGPEGSSWEPMPWFAVRSDGATVWGEVVDPLLEDEPVRLAGAVLLMDHAMARLAAEWDGRGNTFWEYCVGSRFVFASFLADKAAPKLESIGEATLAELCRAHDESVKDWVTSVLRTGEDEALPDVWAMCPTR